uniref:Uncharacterized protein n=1 Tax=Arundo donax TaxID=35708 RepID=A0A0A9GEU1_ARUDO
MEQRGACTGAPTPSSSPVHRRDKERATGTYTCAAVCTCVTLLFPRISCCPAAREPASTR